MRNMQLKNAKWEVLKCESSGCPRVALVKNGVALGDTERPNEGLVYSKKDFATFVRAAKRGELDHLVDESV